MNGLDATLLAKCIKRDEHALYLLYRQYYGLMRGIALRYVFDRDRIGEVVNTGFLKIVNGLDKYDSKQAFEPWASTVMIRVAIDHVRKVMRQKAKLPVDLYEDLTLVGAKHAQINFADLQFDADDLLGMLEILPAQSKVVFNLFAIDGYSHKEIALRLNISEGTSKWHVSKARVRLQEELIRKQKINNCKYEPSNR